MAHNVAKFPSRQKQQGSTSTADERHQRRMAWADTVLAPHIAAIEAASTMEELARVSFDRNSPEIDAACHEALHPADDHTPDHFENVSMAFLKRLLEGRFKGLYRGWERELLRGPSAGQSSGPGGAPYYDWTADLIHTDKGKIIGNVANLLLMMRHHPDWQGVLTYSEFTGAIVIRQPPSWIAVEPDSPWAERATTQAAAWFCRNGMDNPSKDKVVDAVMVVAREQSFHPVRDYFEPLVWDGVPRLATWLQTYLGVKDSAYVRAIGPRFLISAVARIYQPGCQVDHVLVLEGPQGKRKSQAVKKLAPNPAWVADQLSNVANKDAKMEVAGVMIIEIAEMEAVTRAGSSATKRFITNHIDRFRPPYGKHLITWPRQLVFIGTLNPLPGEGWLRDPTGARRFWPVACGEIDLDALVRDRDQLWAEAVHLYTAQMPWHLETPELEALATAEQELRRHRDDWELPIEAWVEGKTQVTIAQVMKGALGLAVSHSGEIRVAKILKQRLGFKYVRPHKTGESRRPCYRREEIESESTTESTTEPDVAQEPRWPWPTKKMAAAMVAADHTASTDRVLRRLREMREAGEKFDGTTTTEPTATTTREPEPKTRKPARKSKRHIRGRK